MVANHNICWIMLYLYHRKKSIFVIITFIIYFKIYCLQSTAHINIIFVELC